LERFRRTRVAMLMYGLAKETYNYGAWRSLGQLHLVYGERSRAKMERYGEVAVVGNPRFDRWHDEGFHARAHRRVEGQLDPTRPTVLYAPTWGELSSVDLYFEEVTALARHYNVLIKAHHNTDVVRGTFGRKKGAGRVHFFGADDEIHELLAVSDVVLCDYSGAIFDALCAERPVILLHSPEPPFGDKLDAHSIEYAAREEIGPVVLRPSQLAPTLQAHFADPAAYRARNDALRSALFDRAPGAALRAANAITDFARRRPTDPMRSPRAGRSDVTEASAAAMLRSRLVAIGREADAGAVLRRLNASHPLQMRLAGALGRVARSPLPLLGAAYTANVEQKSLAAYALLLRAERHWPAHRTVLRMLTQLYRDDADAPRARATLLLQEHLAPVHGALGLLSLETSIGETSRAEAVFDRLEAKLTG